MLVQILKFSAANKGKSLMTLSQFLKPSWQHKIGQQCTKATMLTMPTTHSSQYLQNILMIVVLKPLHEMWVENSINLGLQMD